jgi:hypothetical protein
MRADPPLLARRSERQRCKHFNHLRIDERLAACSGNGDAVMAITHEIGIPDLVELDRRKRFSLRVCPGYAPPAVASMELARAESPVEIAPAISATHDSLD